MQHYRSFSTFLIRFYDSLRLYGGVKSGKIMSTMVTSGGWRLTIFKPFAAATPNNTTHVWKVITDDNLPDNTITLGFGSEALNKILHENLHGKNIVLPWILQ